MQEISFLNQRPDCSKKVIQWTFMVKEAERWRPWLAPNLTIMMQLKCGSSLGRRSITWGERRVEQLLLCIKKRVSWGGLGTWLRCILVSSLWWFSRHILLVGNARADLELSGRILCPLNRENFVIPKEEVECHWGEGCLRFPTGSVASAALLSSGRK